MKFTQVRQTRRRGVSLATWNFVCERELRLRNRKTHLVPYVRKRKNVSAGIPPMNSTMVN